MSPPGMLRAGIINVVDEPCNAHLARAFERFIVEGWSDEEAWAAQFDDQHYLDEHKRRYGNRSKARRRGGQLDLGVA